MPDIEQEVRALLERRSNDVPPHAEVPPTLVRRAHTRFAVNAAGVAAIVVLVAGVATAALRSAPAGPVTTPGGSSAAPVGAPIACTAAQLSATAQLEGAMGSREGAIVVTNTSGTSCVLRGTPTPVLTAAGSGVADVQVVRSEPEWRVDGDAAPRGWPDVTVAPSFQASLRLRWSNWCGDGAPAWALHLDGGSNVGVDGIGVDVPPCNGPGQPSTVEIGPFEPLKG
jgi:hypothetical protein